MNQILSVEMPNDKSKKNKSNINSVIIFFSVILIVFAIILVGIGIYFMSRKSRGQDGNETQNNTVVDQPTTSNGPQIDIQVENEAKLKIIVTHDKEISNVSYRWNDQEAIETSNVKEINKGIEVYVPLGTNTLNISVTDVDGVTKTIEPKEYTNNQDIMLITEQIGNTAKITVESKTTISYISYNWDGGDENPIQVNDNKTEQTIEISEGEHTLNIMAVDVESHEISDSKTFKGDTKPTISYERESGDTFSINASDDEGLTKMIINLNGRDLDEISINNEMNYSTKIQLENIEARMLGNTQFEENENAVIVTVYNINGIEGKLYLKVKKQ